jgi:hypothetical protein
MTQDTARNFLAGSSSKVGGASQQAAFALRDHTLIVAGGCGLCLLRARSLLFPQPAWLSTI